MKGEPYLQRAERIYLEGTLRAQSAVGGRSLIRPYVQAFLIGGELAMGVPQYSQYLLNQVQGCLTAPSSGFTLWNASNRYYMVSAGLKPMLSQGPGPAASPEAGFLGGRFHRGRPCRNQPPRENRAPRFSIEAMRREGAPKLLTAERRIW